MEQTALVKQAIREALRRQRERQKLQRELWQAQEDYHETIRAKLEGLWETTQYEHYAMCGLDALVRTCRSCGKVTNLRTRCNLKWCPRCGWRRVEERRKILAMWASKLQHPKHIVLTQRNFTVLTRAKLREHTRHLAKIRRSKAFKRVRGGCVSVEITNEGRGWHLHSHWLVDAPWVEPPEVSRAWGKLVGQEFAIVKVKDCGEASYLSEVTKYVVEGSELAKWPAEEILEFVTAVKGRRFFFVFGNLFKAGKEIRAALKAEQKPSLPCECGCEDFVIQDEVATIVEEMRRSERGGSAKKSAAHADERKQPCGTRSNATAPDQADFALDTRSSAHGSSSGDERPHLRRANQTPKKKQHHTRNSESRGK